MPCYGVLRCTVLSYHVFVSCCTQSYRVSFCHCYKNLEMHGCNLMKINRKTYILYDDCDGPCDSRLDRAVKCDCTFNLAVSHR